PPTETSRASRALIELGSPDWFLDDRTRNILVKYSIWTNPLITVMNTPKTTRMGMSAHPQVRSSTRPKKPVTRSIGISPLQGAIALMFRSESLPDTPLDSWIIRLKREQHNHA